MFAWIRAQLIRLFPRQRRRVAQQRRGVVLVVFALCFVVILGMVGFVVDLAVLQATHRQAQNAADAAAIAAAVTRFRGGSIDAATATATTFVQTHNGLTSAPAPIVSSPPASGAYAGRSGYIQVVVNVPLQTYLIHILGVARDQQVTARAVAGYEAHSSGEGVAVLNAGARPGLNVSGGGTLRVNGRVVVNSEGGGVDEFGVPVNNGNNGVAASGGQPSSLSGIYAQEIKVVGGVDNPASFKPYDPEDPPPLRAKQAPEPDPLINLPVPIVGKGVDPARRGDISINNTNVSGLVPGGLNYVAQGGESVANGLHTATAGEVILHPGIYEALKITGGTTYLVPGIYVISPPKNTTNALQITGGTVTAERVMFYNTAGSYSPSTGTPDVNDGEDKTPLPNTEYAGGFTLNAGMKMSPIDTTKVNYASLYPMAPVVSSDFDGMLFFQRRRHQAGIQIQGNSSEGVLAGTLYAKWSNFQISGQGTYDAQFIAGSISVTGQGNVTILSSGGGRGRAFQIYLVE